MLISKKVTALLFLCIVCLLVFIASRFFPKKVEVKQSDVIAGVIACLLSDTCKVPVTVENFKGTQVTGMYLKIPEKGINIKYAIIDGGLSVVVVKDDKNQISLNDVDVDGLVDIAFITENGVTHDAGDPKYGDDVEDLQALYMVALKHAWKRVISEDLKKAFLDNLEEEGKTGKVPKKNIPNTSKYST